MSKIKLREFRFEEDIAHLRHDKTITLFSCPESQHLDGEPRFEVKTQSSALGCHWDGNETKSRDLFAKFVRDAWASERKAKAEGRFAKGGFIRGSFVQDDPE